jgi:hypothetical protein
MKDKPKQGARPDELRMSGAKFDEIMRGAVQVAPEKPIKPSRQKSKVLWAPRKSN